MKYILKFNDFLFEHNEINNGNVVLILSNDFKDGFKRIYMSTIKKIRFDHNSNTEKVELNHQFYILKTYHDGTIMPETIAPLSENDMMRLFNMKSNILYLNDNKTPLWHSSIQLTKKEFFNTCQELLKKLTIQYNIIYPKTTYNKKPLLENYQLVDKIYFKTNIIPENIKDIILSITNGNNYTKALCDAYLMFKDAYRIGAYSIRENNYYGIFKMIYELITNYNKNVFPIKDYDVKDLTKLENLEVLIKRNKIIEDLNSLPSVAKRNLKTDIKKERDYSEMDSYLHYLNFFISEFSYIEGKSEYIKNILIKKIFKNNNTLDDLLQFMEDKQNIIHNKKYTLESFKKMLYDKTDVVTLYDKNNILVIQIDEPEDIKIIGDISLWCFTYGKSEGDFYEYSTNGMIYVIIDFNANQETDNYFMTTLIKPLEYKSKWKTCDYEDEKNIGKLFDILNNQVDNPIKYLSKLISFKECKRLFTFEN